MQRRFERLYGQELQDLIAREPIAWVPLGILERHGEHLPYGLDADKAHGVCLRLAEAHGGVVLPPTHLAGVHEPWNKDPEIYRAKRREVGDFYLRPETFRMLLEDTVDGLANLGFATIVLYTGHYPYLQVRLLREVADERTAAGVARVLAFHEPDAMDGKGDHAGKSETALHMALGFEVRLDAIRPEHANKIGFFSTNWPTPDQASVAFGEEVIARAIEHFRRLLHEPGLAHDALRQDLHY